MPALNSATLPSKQSFDGTTIDSLIAITDSILDRHEPSDEPEVGDYENGLALSAAMSQGWR